MKINEYQKEVTRTINKDLSEREQILNYCLGLSGEVGEVIDLIKKELFQEHERDLDKLVDEIGDVFWYIANLCNELGFDIETILDMNIEKLKKRYPNGFKKEDSENRNIRKYDPDMKLEMSIEDEGEEFDPCSGYHFDKNGKIIPGAYTVNGYHVDADGNLVEDDINDVY